MPWLRELGASMASHPLQWVRLMFKKLGLFWWAFEIPSNTNFYLAGRLVPWLMFLPLSFAVVAGLGVVGLATGLPGTRATRLTGLLLALSMASVVAVFVVDRLRLLVVPWLALFAGCAVVRIWQSFQAKRTGKAVVMCVAAVVLTCLTTLRLPAPDERIRQIDYYNLAAAYRVNGNMPSAVTTLELAIAADPTFVPALQEYLRSAAGAGDVTRHIEFLRRMTADHPEAHQARASLNLLLQARGSGGGSPDQPRP